MRKRSRKPDDLHAMPSGGEASGRVGDWDRSLMHRSRPGYKRVFWINRHKRRESQDRSSRLSPSARVDRPRITACSSCPQANLDSFPESSRRDSIEMKSFADSDPDFDLDLGFADRYSWHTGDFPDPTVRVGHPRLFPEKTISLCGLGLGTHP